MHFFWKQENNRFCVYVVYADGSSEYFAETDNNKKAAALVEKLNKKF